MTITYSLDVANTRFCGFAKLLGRWKGSIYKILWKEFLVFIVGYSLISITYRLFLDESERRTFEKVVIYFENFTDFIPLSFVLGFYVSLVIGRWWDQFDAIPWPDRLCYMIATYVHGADERSRMIRRTLGRYLILMQAFTFQGVSTAVKRRFPTSQHLVAAGLMTKGERTVYENLNPPFSKWWMPGQWFASLAMRARKEGRIKDSILLSSLFREFVSYRSACGTMFNYDWISVPLVYTQVVTLATYTYSLALMVGRQYLDPAQGYKRHKMDLYVPVFTLLQFFFYVGWLKVAEQIVNPYGEDDDDFELNYCLNRSSQIVFLLVDHFHTKHPKLRKDAFWDILLPELPQTKSTARTSVNPQLGSAFNLEVNPEDAEFLPLDTVLEDDNEANAYISDSVQLPSGVRYRPSFLASLLNYNFVQSIRKRSMQKTESFRDGQANTNLPFAPKAEKFSSPRGSFPAHSRKSSTSKRSSPSHSRASSISFHPGSISRHRHKSYDLQHSESSLANGVNPVSEKSGINAATTASITPVAANFEEGSQNTNSVMESDSGHQKLDSYMPPILEEPTSRAVSTANVNSNGVNQCSPKPLGDVQTLVAEASKVLDELNRVVKYEGHRKDCEAKGYESCCSLDSDDSSEDEDNGIRKVSGVDINSDSERVDLSKASSDDGERTSVDDMK